MSEKRQKYHFKNLIVLDCNGEKLPKIHSDNMYVEPCDLYMLKDLEIFTKNLRKSDIPFILGKFETSDTSVVEREGGVLAKKDMVVIFWTPPRGKKEDTETTVKLSGQEGDLDFYTSGIEFGDMKFFKNKQGEKK
jgi:hypothetical protein